MLLHVRAITGSFAAAGAAVGAYLGASAVTAPFIGRWIDRRGARGALIAMGIASPLALLALWVAEPLRLSASMILLIAALAGASAPPITVLTRTMWRHRFSDADARKTAFALDSVLVELAFTLGPALIALLLAVGSPTIAFGAAFVFSTLAVPTFLASPALRYWRHDPHAERHLLGPLTEPRLLAVFATTFLLTCSLGMLEIAYPGFAARAANPPLAGVLLAINSDRQRDRRIDLRRRAFRACHPSGNCAACSVSRRPDRDPRGHHVGRRSRDRRIRRRLPDRTDAYDGDDAGFVVCAEPLRDRSVHVVGDVHHQRHRRRECARRRAAGAIRSRRRVRRVGVRGAARRHVRADAEGVRAAARHRP